MNKPINNQLELVPVATANGTAHTDPALLAALGRAGVPPAEAERLIAQGGPDDFDWSTDDSVVVKPRPGAMLLDARARSGPHGRKYLLEPTPL